MNIQPKDTGGGGGETRESIVYKLSDDMLEKLPQDYLEHEVRGFFFLSITLIIDSLVNLDRYLPVCIYCINLRETSENSLHYAAQANFSCWFLMWLFGA